MTDVSAYSYDVAELPAEDGGGFIVTFPDIPGVIGIADDREEAIADAQQALFACLDALKAVDRQPPAPTAPRQQSAMPVA
jgi:predicted RNase H-like HicB family nuclease